MQDGGGKKKKGSPAPNVEGKQIGIAEPGGVLIHPVSLLERVEPIASEFLDGD